MGTEMSEMKFLVVGLGSMGKRRVRNLQALGEKNIAGFDLRADRREEAASNYGIATFASFDESIAAFAPDALIISVSPECHMQYAWQALGLGLSCFIEASVVEVERILALSEAVQGSSIVMAPSCTMRYFPGPLKVKEILRSGRLGKVLNINYQTGQYLPDWHPWEDIASFYVSRRETGGGREIVPFELTWLNELFGLPTPLACVKAKLTDMPADIDDIYHCLLAYPQGVLANVTVEVISRPAATRELRVLCAEGELVMSADENCVRYIAAGDADWTRIDLGGGTVELGYINPEEPYISEMADFVASAKDGDPALFPNTLKDDWAVLQVLHGLEQLAQPTEIKK
jgi:predicted dehydrogenase